ncbi:flavodoxin [Williamsia herbipolensis]|uniref:Flavodoxin n=1 Tax=Williamsia herbipolensis TaxID=1603258 RepID=A0AAU4JXG3_9NOCA|nr:flavodoxin [Williamsia herbipolensis]
MTDIVVSSSRSPHSNTRRVADAIAEALNAQVVTPHELTQDMIDTADRVGFGSGIYWFGFDRQLGDAIDRFPAGSRDCFVFGTSGLPEPPFRRYTAQLGRRLEERGFRVVGTFICRGLDTWGPFGLIGGINKGRPSSADLEHARDFAASLMS